MEAEFVNIFVEKQRETIIDLVSRNIMLESRMVFAEKTVEQAKQQAQEAAVLMQVDIDEALKTTAAKEAVIAEKDKELNHLKVKVKDLTTEAEQLRVKVKQMTLEQEVLIAKTNRLKNKAKQLTEE